MELSIIIVNYNTKKLVEKCLLSIEKYPPNTSYEIIVVDNCSTDKSDEYIKTLQNGILLSQNLGYSRANNIAIKASKGDYILLLNPDTEVLENTLSVCLDQIKSKKNVGILGCRVVMPNGKLDLACKRGFPTLLNSFFKFTYLSKLFPKSKLLGGYNQTYLSENESNFIDCVVGAFMLIKREVITKIGLLDESFFMYGEDIDFCYRAKKSGFLVYYYADAKIIHHKGASSKKSSKALFEFYNAMKIFYKKHYIKKGSNFYYLFVCFLIDVMYFLNKVVNKLKKG